MPANSIAYNNTAKGLNVQSDAKITNNTISGKVLFSDGVKNSILEDNIIKGNIEIPSLVTNVTLKGNEIIGSITLDGSFNKLYNNRITTTGEYAVYSNKLGKNNTLTDNYMVANGKVGADAVYLRGESNTIKESTLVTVIVLSAPSGSVVNKSVQVTIKLMDKNGNVVKATQVTVTSSVGTETVNLTDGTGVYQYTPTAIGEDTVTVNYIGNESFYLSTNSTKINVTAEQAKPVVTKYATKITAKYLVMTYNTNPSWIATLKDANGNALKNTAVSVLINGKTKILTTNDKGQIKIATSGLAPKSYSVKISFKGTSILNSVAKTVKLTIKKATPKVSAKAKTFKVKVKTKKYTITLKNNVNKVMKNTKVTLKVKGKTYKAKTNSKGHATFKITKLTKKGKYSAVIKYAGSSYYNKLSKNVRITIK